MKGRGRCSGEVGRDVAWRGRMERANDQDEDMEVGTRYATRRSTSRYRGRVESEEGYGAV